MENAFGTVDRRLLAAMLFDTPATKPLWRYFHMRYGRYATHHVFGAEYDGTIRSSVGLNQGDPIYSFLFAFFVSDLRVPSAVEVMQIHDDTYVVTTTDKVDSCLSELQEYYRGKQLRLRPQKTKILDGSMSSHVKIGGGYVHARGIPIPPETVEKFDFLPMLQQLPLQHSAYVLRQVVIPKWTSLLQSTDPRIVAPCLPMIQEAQRGFVRRILKAANSDTIPFDEHQIWAPATLGGLGLFNPTPDSHEYVENHLCDTDRLAVNAVPKDSDMVLEVAQLRNEVEHLRKAAQHENPDPPTVAAKEKEKSNAEDANAEAMQLRDEAENLHKGAQQQENTDSTAATRHSLAERLYEKISATHGPQLAIKIVPVILEQDVADVISLLAQPQELSRRVAYAANILAGSDASPAVEASHKSSRTAPTCTCGRIEGFCIHSQSSRARQRARSVGFAEAVCHSFWIDRFSKQRTR